MSEPDTATRILDAAQELLQTRGYNGFSYRDVEERVGIRTASIHYHFATKGDLGVAIARRYRTFVKGETAEFEREESTPARRLKRYAALLESVLTRGNRICVGGMLASDFATLPPEVQAEVTGFVADNERWLTGVLREGKANGTLAFEGTAEAAATTLFSALEGAMFVARSSGDLSRYRRTAEWLLGALNSPVPSTRSK